MIGVLELLAPASAVDLWFRNRCERGNGWMSGARAGGLGLVGLRWGLEGERERESDESGPTSALLGSRSLFVSFRSVPNFFYFVLVRERTFPVQLWDSARTARLASYRGIERGLWASGRNDAESGSV
jgi:hypothetical protein